jgi:hypothetical protein
MRDDWDSQRTKTGDAAFAALERLMPGLKQMWYDLCDFEQQLGALRAEVDHMKSEATRRVNDERT